ncbi:MAG: hypothetical protein ACFB0G_07695 [Leptolyngbyaceae cyanobacterium]
MLAPFLSGIAIAREQTVILLLLVTITVATLYPSLPAPSLPISVALFRHTGLETSGLSGDRDLATAG